MSLEKVAVALDGMSRESAFSFLKKTKGRIKLVKVGMELFYKEGKSIIHELKQNFNVDIFLDLKIHDIPKTCENAIHSLEDLKNDLAFLTIHMSGGKEMCEAALKACKISLPHTTPLFVTILTSLDDINTKALWNQSLAKLIVQYSQSIHDWKIPAIVCSPIEALIYKTKNPKILTMTPGVRFPQDDPGDQKRIMSPDEALKNGCDYLVMGRSLTQASDLFNRLDHLANL
jgi:orotidine-5'-phosphate decarboxylase